ncbi:MAG: hypothetical protein ACTS6G_00670 [Candidatus Hodgkinia cicadicola]
MIWDLANETYKTSFGHEHKRIPKSTLHKTVDRLLNKLWHCDIFQAFAGYTLLEVDILRSSYDKRQNWNGNTKLDLYATRNGLIFQLKQQLAYLIR